MTAPLPAPFEATSDPFTRLILIKAMRDEQAQASVNAFVRLNFGDRLADPSAGKMEEIYEGLDNCTPCIFILSKGSDPTGMLFKFARQMDYGDRLSLVSLGQGQGPAAQSLVDRGTRSGDWVLLQNCMRVPRRLPVCPVSSFLVVVEIVTPPLPRAGSPSRGCTTWSSWSWTWR